MVPGFCCSFRLTCRPPWPRGVRSSFSVQTTDIDIGLRRGPKGSALHPAIRFTRGTVFAATLVRYCCGLSGCWPPCTDLTGLPATGGFYFQAFDGSVTLPVAGYDYDSDWTPLLAGLSPAGIAASLAALVRPCSRPSSIQSWQGARSKGARHFCRLLADAAKSALASARVLLRRD